MSLQNGIVMAGADVLCRSESGNVIIEAATSGKKIQGVVNGTKVLEFSSSGLLQATTRLFSAATGVIGATAGFALPSAHAGFTNAAVAGCPASQTGSTFVIPVTGLVVGEQIVSWSLIGQIESAGNAVTVDGDLRKLTVAAANVTDASIGALTQISKTADYAIADSKTLATAEVVAADEFFYVVITVTTLGSTDVQIVGVSVTTTVP